MEEQTAEPQKADTPSPMASPVPSTSGNTNRQKKREDKIRRRDSKALENILKLVNSVPEQDRLLTLSNKYGELYDEFRNLQIAYAALKKQSEMVQKEKDQLQTEQGRSVLARSRLESLCRELQRQNKLIKEENIARIREEEERRKEVASKFQATLTDLTALMQENTDKNFKLQEDNRSMTQKIAMLCEQFEKREGHITRMDQQMAIERQLAEATINQLKFEIEAEREIWAKERAVLESNLQKSEATGVQLQANIKAVEEHLSLYTGRYKEFESTITKSNKVFDNCKSEMMKMTKKITTLEKEAAAWKMRWQKNAQSLLELTELKSAADLEVVNAEKKINQLNKLCRQLQSDRSAYIKLLKANNIEPVAPVVVAEPSSTVSEPTAPPLPEGPSKKEQELKLLKGNLRILQEQLDLEMQKGANDKQAVIQAEVTENGHDEPQPGTSTDGQEQSTEDGPN